MNTKNKFFFLTFLLFSSSGAMDSDMLRPVVNAWKVPAAFGAAYFGCMTAEMSKNLFVAAKETRDEGDVSGGVIFGTLGMACGG